MTSESKLHLETPDEGESGISHAKPEQSNPPADLTEVIAERNKRVMQVVRQLSPARSLSEVEATFYSYLGVIDPADPEALVPEEAVDNMSIELNPDNKTVTVKFPAGEEDFVDKVFFRYIGGEEISRKIIT